MKSRTEQAVALFKEGYNCSQAVFAAYADLFGIDRTTALRLSASFGAGIGRLREVCGAACGMFLVAGMLTGSTEGPDQTAKKKNYEVVQLLAKEYQKKNSGTYICKEILANFGKQVTVGDTTPEARTDEYYKKRPCVLKIREAAEIVERVLLEGLLTEDENGKDVLLPEETLPGGSYADEILKRYGERSND